ncbi:MAG: Nif3-like dinuclear metal center hexameric protein [Anaerofustis sp.]
MKVNEIVRVINSFADESWAFDRDNSGLQVGENDMEVNRILFAVDPTEYAVDEAITKKCQMIITHHPLLFLPIKNITSKDARSNIIKKLLINGIALYASHTCFDVSPKGINAYIADCYHLLQRKYLGDWAENFYSLEAYVPSESCENFLKHLYDVGVGSVGLYQDCAYLLDGQGRFTPSKGSNPTIGSIEIPTRTQETKVEAIFPRKRKNAVISQIMKYHPYETPVFHISEFINVSAGIGIGVIGNLSEDVSIEEFLAMTKKIFQTETFRISNNYHGRSIRRVAFSSGSSAEYIPAANRMGADVMITSECKSYDFESAINCNMVLISLTHFISEHCFADAMTQALRQTDQLSKNIEFIFSAQSDAEVIV